MKQLYYGKPTRRFKIRRFIPFYLEKVKVNSKTVTHPLLMLRFLRVGDTRLTVSPSLPNGKNFFDSSVKYRDLVVKAQFLAEKLSHLWANVGCVIQLQTNEKEGMISITRTNVPTLDQFFPIDTRSRPVGIDSKVSLHLYTQRMSKVTTTLSRSLTRGFNKIEREASALVQEFLKEIQLTPHGVALGGVGAAAIGAGISGVKSRKAGNPIKAAIDKVGAAAVKQMENDHYDIVIDAVLSKKPIPASSLSKEGLKLAEKWGLNVSKAKAKKSSKAQSKKSHSVSKEELNAFFASKRQGKKNKKK